MGQTNVLIFPQQWHKRKHVKINFNLTRDEDEDKQRLFLFAIQCPKKLLVGKEYIENAFSIIKKQQEQLESTDCEGEGPNK